MLGPICASTSRAGLRTCLHLVPAAQVPHRRGGRPTHRCIAVKSGKDKTWGEILQDAGNLAGTVVEKIGDTVKSIVKAPSNDGAPPGRVTRKTPEPLAPPSAGFLPSLLGRAVSGLFASAVDALAASASEAAAAQADVASRATARLHSSARLRERFGDVSVGPITSTSSSTMSLNGVTSKQIVLVLPVNGSRGQSGQAQVQYSAGSQGERMQIRVITGSGEVINVGDGDNNLRSGASQGRIIDAEFREVK